VKLTLRKATLPSSRAGRSACPDWPFRIEAHQPVELAIGGAGGGEAREQGRDLRERGDGAA
jgi:hypothetical protein